MAAVLIEAGAGSANRSVAVLTVRTGGGFSLGILLSRGWRTVGKRTGFVRPVPVQAESPDGLDAKEPHVCNLGQRGGKMDDIWTLGVNAEDEFAWHQHALCAQTDPEAFFPEKGGSTREAKRVCSSCTVRAECLEYALANDERFGIWGGLSERERRKLKRQAI